jgi:Animal haem peroxidase
VVKGKTISRHGKLIRGLEAAGRSPDLQGARFGRMFPHLPGATFGKTRAQEHKNLEKLAAAMISGFDAPRDGPDDEESGIPALYTYFGQFIDHDLTFDPDASFQKRKDPGARVDFRTPAFDLDNLYGRGPGDQPYMYAEDHKSLLLGDPLTLGAAGARDLQRNGAGRGLIGDPRNDENAIVSQLQGLMIRFHNAMVAHHPSADFEKIQELVRHHYQYVVANDFLPRIVSKSVLDRLRTKGVYDKSKIRFFTNFAPPYGTPYMPIEFSVAAYRLGHSMVRPGYRLNDATLLPIFPLPPELVPNYPEGLTGFRRMISDWGIDWGRFIDIDLRPYGSKTDDDAHKVENFLRLQLAYRLDTALVDPLGSLPLSVAGNPPPSLALRNLLRGREFKLPSGQTVAAAIGTKPLADKDILIGQGVDKPKPRLKDIVAVGGKVFAGNCPLWTYVLAEAMHYRTHMKIPVTQKNKKIWTPQLGPVGGRIVAEVFLQLLFSDPGSYLHENPHWQPRQGKDFRLKDLVAMALAG